MNHRSVTIATLLVFGIGILWGLYWLPVRALEDQGLPGPWGTAAITGVAAMLLAPFAWHQRRVLYAAHPLVLGSVALGGAAFALYSIGFVYGRVAIIILLYFLTPVWSVLIGRFVMGWPTTRLRLLAILVGLLGLGVMLGADGTVPIPRGMGEWMALIAGLAWAFATTGLHGKADLPPLGAAFIFALGALVTALALALILEPLPSVPMLSTLGIALGAGALWWSLPASVFC